MTSLPSKRPAPADKEDMLAEVKRRAAEAKARIDSMRNGHAIPQTTSLPAASANGTATGTSKPSMSLDAIKARIAAAQRKSAPSPDAPPLQPPPERAPAREALSSIGSGFVKPLEKEQDRLSRGGVNIQLHPLLRQDADEEEVRRQDQRGRGGGARDERTSARSNPYIQEGIAAASGRKRRELNFTHDMNNRPALEAANELRRKANLEAMKAKIQASTTRAGLDEAADITCFQIPEPPDVEWWDEPLTTDLGLKEHITNLVVHPVLIDPAQEKFTTGKMAVMYLTKKEQKKMRRIRRAEQHKDEQTKIRLGLAPAPAPKINHKNVMRVYGELAVQGPSAVEEMVNKQVAERLQQHEQANTERQLTKEQKSERIQRKATENASMGLFRQVFKIDLSSDKFLAKHRFLVNKNAMEWADMFGFILVTPSFALVFVEGGNKSTAQYKKLMLRRIKWQAILEGGGEILDKEAWANVEDNTAVLMHEGQIRERRFRKWGGIREVDSDQRAREQLVKTKLDNFWVMAKGLEKGTGI